MCRSKQKFYFTKQLTEKLTWAGEHTAYSTICAALLALNRVLRQFYLRHLFFYWSCLTELICEMKLNEKKEQEVFGPTTELVLNV